MSAHGGDGSVFLEHYPVLRAPKGFPARFGRLVGDSSTLICCGYRGDASFVAIRTKKAWIRVTQIVEANGGWTKF
jgi:hypothetical protein